MATGAALISSTTPNSPLLPNQPQQEPVSNPEEATAVPSSNAWQNSGSIAPFFAAISVLIVLAVGSCLFARFCVGREDSPLESIKYGSSGRWFGFGWMKRWCRKWRRADDIELGKGRKVAAAAAGTDVNATEEGK